MKDFLMKDIFEIQEEQKYKYIGLYDQSGNKVIPFNSNATSANSRLKEIETRLLSAGLKDGFYNVCCKNALKGGTADNYLIKKGENLSENTTANIPIVQTLPPDLLSYQQALKLNVEVERLKMENTALKKEIELFKQEQREQELTLLNEEEDESPLPGLMENAKSFLTEAMSFVAPLLDKHFELKEKQLGLQAIQIQNRMNNNTKRPSPEQPGSKAREKNNTKDFILSYKDQTEVYEKLAAFYNNATSEEQFLRNVNEYNGDIFKELIEWNKN